MSKLIDCVEFLLIALLIVFCAYVGWKAITSVPPTRTQAAAFGFASAETAP